MTLQGIPVLKATIYIEIIRNRMVFLNQTAVLSSLAFSQKYRLQEKYTLRHRVESMEWLLLNHGIVNIDSMRDFFLIKEIAKDHPDHKLGIGR